MNFARQRLALVGAVLLTGCAYPRTIHVYDEACQITSRQMVLDMSEVNAGRGCIYHDCIAQLVGEVTVLAASTVISGSIVVAGNVVYWLEKKRNCNPKPAGPEPIVATHP